MLVIIWYKKLVSFWKPTVQFPPHKMWFYQILVSIVIVCESANSISYNLNSYEFLDDQRSSDNVKVIAQPVALLVDDAPENYRNVLQLLQRETFGDSDLWLITFNSSGVSTIWEEKVLNNENKFYNTLQKLAADSESNSHSNQSLPVFALLRTARVLPNNSAVVVFSNGLINGDKDLENEALSWILDKNITVYTVNENNSQTYLKTIRKYSGGRVLGVTPTSDSYKYQSHSTPSNVSLILFRKNLQNESDLTFPIDSAVTAIHITIKPSFYIKGELTSPGGYGLLFINETTSNPIKFSRGSFFDDMDGGMEIHLNFSTTTRLIVGTWRLKLKNQQEAYNVTVFAFTKKFLDTVRFPDDQKGNNSVNKDMLKLGVTGDISHITDVSLLDSNGETLLKNISYKFNNGHLNYVTENKDNTTDIGNKNAFDILSKARLAEPLYTLIKGKDVKGHYFQRLSYFSRKSDIYPLQLISIEVGLGSELFTATDAQTWSQIYFEITNHGTTAQYITYQCTHSRAILHRLSSFQSYLEPQGHTMVILSILTRSGNYQDELSFIVKSGFQTVQKKVLIDVGVQIMDDTAPELEYHYKSDCTEVLFSQCYKGIWTIEVVARDVDSGLMRLNSIPKGLYVPYGYTVGTKNSITGHYSESCCNPDLQLIAVDRQGNQKSYSVNAYQTLPSIGVIAAIVLGVILFIILLVVLIIVVVKKCKAKRSYELRSYRGGRI